VAGSNQNTVFGVSIMTPRLASLAAKKEKGKRGMASRERGMSPILAMFISLTVLLLVVPGVVSATTNKITNGGFEWGDTAGWSSVTPGDFYADTDTIHTGTYEGEMATGVWFYATTDTVTQSVDLTGTDNLTFWFRQTNFLGCVDPYFAVSIGSNEVYNVSFAVDTDYHTWTQVIIPGGYTGVQTIKFTTHNTGNLLQIDLDDISAYSSAQETNLIVNDTGGSFLQHTTDGNYLSMRNGIGEDSWQGGVGLVQIGAAAGADTFSAMTRTGLSFDTSTLPDNATITSAVLDVCGLDKNNYWFSAPSYLLVGFTPATNGSVVQADYNTYGSTRLAVNVSYASLDTSGTYGHNRWVLNADGLSYISKTSWTNLMLRDSNDFDSVSPTWHDAGDNRFSFVTHNTVGKEAHLTITYTMPAPVASFTKNSTGGVPIRPVAFTDTSTDSPTAWSWSHTDVTNGTLVETVFSTSQNPTETFGAGNWSIQLNASSTNGYSKTAANTSWVNVSAGNVTGLAIPAGFKFYPSDYILNTPIDTLPVNASSASYINMLNDGHDTGLWIAQSAMPINPVNSSITKSNYTHISYCDIYYLMSDCDISYPILDDPVVEADYDYHMIQVDTTTNELWESWENHKSANGTWYVESAGKYNMASYTFRPAGFSVADLSGIPIAPLVVRYDEVQSGEITHALRFAAVLTGRNNGYIFPARNGGVVANTSIPPVGARFRLKSSFDISGYTPQQKIILTALKKYGMFLVDNTGSLPDHTHWIIYVDNKSQPWDFPTDWNGIKATNFEMVDEGGLIISADSGQANQTATHPLPSITMAHSGIIRIPRSATFNATSTTTATSWLWDFGDGSA
jgi:PKD repeat protein